MVSNPLKMLTINLLKILFYERIDMKTIKLYKEIKSNTNKYKIKMLIICFSAYLNIFDNYLPAYFLCF